MKIETLKRLCERSGLAGWRGDMCAHPWNLSWSGTPHIIATDAKAMIVMKGKIAGVDHFPADGCKVALPYLQWETGGDHVKIQALQSWAGPPTWEDSVRCWACKGVGRMPCRECDVDEFCDADGHADDGTIPCDYCDGVGSSREMPMRLGLLNGAPFNRTLVACCLESVDPACLALVELRPIDERWRCLVVNGPDWRLWIMGIMATGAKDDSEPWPALCLQG